MAPKLSAELQLGTTKQDSLCKHLYLFFIKSRRNREQDREGETGESKGEIDGKEREREGEKGSKCMRERRREREQMCEREKERK